MKKGFFVILLLTVFVNYEAKSQDTLYLNRGTFKEFGLIAGYNYSIEDSDSKKYHLVEFGIIRSRYSNYHHPVSSSLYFSNELGLNTKDLVWGPKVGAFVGFWLFVVGAEAIYYTNFQEGALRAAPYIGLGGHLFKLTVNPHIKISNKGFPLNSGNFNLTIRPFVVKKLNLIKTKFANTARASCSANAAPAACTRPLAVLIKTTHI